MKKRRKEGEKEASDQYLCVWLYCGTGGKRRRVEWHSCRPCRRSPSTKAKQNKKGHLFWCFGFGGLCCPVLCCGLSLTNRAKGGVVALVVWNHIDRWQYYRAQGASEDNDSVIAYRMTESQKKKKDPRCLSTLSLFFLVVVVVLVVQADKKKKNLFSYTPHRHR